jgi:hypothetical protein
VVKAEKVKRGGIVDAISRPESQRRAQSTEGDPLAVVTESEYYDDTSAASAGEETRS